MCTVCITVCLFICLPLSGSRSWGYLPQPSHSHSWVTQYFYFLSSRLRVGVEDGQSETCILVTVLVSPHMTIAQLKDKVLVFQQVINICSLDIHKTRKSAEWGWGLVFMVFQPTCPLYSLLRSVRTMASPPLCSDGWLGSGWLRTGRHCTATASVWMKTQLTFLSALPTLPIRHNNNNTGWIRINST